ncbi:MAG: hypothetical protein ACLP9L_23750 [Thermoguttaceae bacterium]
MSNYPPPQGFPEHGYPQENYPPQQPRSGCGGCLGKFFIFLGVVFLLIIAICCGGFYYVKSSFTDQPAEAQKISDDIASLRVPAPLEPMGGGRVKIPFSGTLIAEVAIYSDKEHKCVVILGSIGEALGQNFKEQLLQNMESGQFQQKPGDNDKNDKSEALKDVKKSRVERTIRDQKATFEIAEGVGAKTNVRKIRVQGDFLGKSGPAILVIDAEEKTLSEEKVKELIDSIE